MSDLGQSYSIKGSILPPSYNTYSDDIQPTTQQHHQQPQQQQYHHTTTTTTTTTTPVLRNIPMTRDPISASAHTALHWKSADEIQMSDYDYHAPHPKFCNSYLLQLLLYMGIIMTCILSLMSGRATYNTPYAGDVVVWFIFCVIHWGFAPLCFLITLAVFLAGICCNGYKRPYVRDTMITPQQAHKRVRLHKIKFGFEFLILITVVVIAIVYSARLRGTRDDFDGEWAITDMYCLGVIAQIMAIGYLGVLFAEHNMIYWSQKRLEFVEQCASNITLDPE